MTKGELLPDFVLNSISRISIRATAQSYIYGARSRIFTARETHSSIKMNAINTTEWRQNTKYIIIIIIMQRRKEK